MPNQVESIEHAIPLAEMVAALRQELERAMQEGRDKAVQFALDDIELELNVGISRQAGGQGGVQFWVFTLGASASRTASTTHTIRVALKARTAAGEDIRIKRETRQKSR
jgi:hypothetical protein